MCDDRTERDLEHHLRRRGMTRRDFNSALSTAALAVLLPPIANASEVRESEVMVPTPEGEARYEPLTPTYRESARQRARLRQSGGKDVVTVGCTTAVASLWLSPALIRFWRRYPDVQVNQVAQDWPFTDDTALDFFICYGKSPKQHLTQVPIYRDTLVPVTAPDHAQTLAQEDLSALAGQRLIHLEAANASWTRWSEWFAHLGYTDPLAPGAKVTSYAVALQLACEGAGVALGWRRLVQPMLNAGQLAVVGAWSIPAPHQFYLAGQPDSELSAEAVRLKDWLLAEANATSDELI